MDMYSKHGVHRESASDKKRFDYLEVQNDLLLAVDIIAGIASGYLSITMYFYFVRASLPTLAVDGPVWREIILGGLIAALVVREPHLADRRHLLKPWSIATSVGQRCACALAILLSVGLATRALDDVARLWVFAWAATWTAWVALSRWALLGYTERLCTRGEFRETVAVLGAPDLADRLAANLSNDAEIVVVIDDLDDVMDGIIYPALAKLQELTGLGMIDTATLALAAGDEAEVASFVEHPMAIQVNITICNEPWSAEKLEYRPEAEWLFFEKNQTTPPKGGV